MGNPAQRQRRVAAKAARRKIVVAEKKKLDGSALGVAARIRLASRGAIARCARSSTLFEHGMGYVVIAREMPTGMLGCAFFLVDSFCLGVKDVFFRELSRTDLKAQFDALDTTQIFVDVTPESARKLIDDAIDYAASLGLSPAEDTIMIEAIFGDADPDECTETFPFGKDGQPLYIPGPNEGPAQIRAVTRALQSRVIDHEPVELLEAPEHVAD